MLEEAVLLWVLQLLRACQAALGGSCEHCWWWLGGLVCERAAQHQRTYASLLLADVLVAGRLDRRQHRVYVCNVCSCVAGCELV